MPELPEVETIRRDLQKAITGKKIVEVKVIKDNLVRGSTADFISILTNNTCTEVKRRAKLLIFSFEEDTYLTVHLKMTGQLMYHGAEGILAGGHSQKKEDLVLPHKYTYIIFSFNDGSTLFFNCMRQFGYMEIIGKEKKEQIEKGYGVEPLEKVFTLEKYKEIIKGKKTSVKSFLLNQKYIAGIGNIYADEICFHAHISPQRKIETLVDKEIETLYHAIIYIITKAVEERGTTFNNYKDANGNKGNFLQFLQVYGRGGKGCFRCKDEILIKDKIAGRGTVYCHSCQK